MPRCIDSNHILASKLLFQRNHLLLLHFKANSKIYDVIFKRQQNINERALYGRECFANDNLRLLALGTEPTKLEFYWQKEVFSDSLQ